MKNDRESKIKVSRQISSIQITSVFRVCCRVIFGIRFKEMSGLLYGNVPNPNLKGRGKSDLDESVKRSAEIGNSFARIFLISPRRIASKACSAIFSADSD